MPKHKARNEAKHESTVLLYMDVLWLYYRMNTDNVKYSLEKKKKEIIYW